MRFSTIAQVIGARLSCSRSSTHNFVRFTKKVTQKKGQVLAAISLALIAICETFYVHACEREKYRKKS